MANNCIISEGLEFGCNIAGGVERVLIATFDEATQYTLDTSADENLIVGATAAPTFYEISSDIEFAELAQEINADRSAGSVFYETTVTIKGIHYTNRLRNFLVAAGRAPLVALVKSNAGDWALAGFESPGRVQSGQAGFGREFGDMNGAELEIVFRSQSGVYFVDSDIVGTDFPIS